MIHNDYLEKAYFEGEIIDFKDANVPIATAGLQYAIATFAGLRGYRQSDGSMAILRLADHAQRMAESVKILGFPYKKTPEKFLRSFIYNMPISWLFLLLTWLFRKIFLCVSFVDYACVSA